LKRIDVIASLFLGGAASLLMLLMSRNVALPASATPYVAPFLVAFPAASLGAMAVGSSLGRRVAVLYQFTKFALVGGLNFLLDLGVLNLLIAITDVSQGTYANGFKAVSFLVALLSSFAWNKFWTFGSSSTRQAGRQFVAFFLVSAVGLLINVTAFSLINNSGWAHEGVSARAWANIAAVGASVTAIAWNFVGYKFIVFRRRLA